MYFEELSNVLFWIVDEIVPIRKKSYFCKFSIEWTKVHVINKIRYNTEQINIAPTILLIIHTLQ